MSIPSAILLILVLLSLAHAQDYSRSEAGNPLRTECNYTAEKDYEPFAEPVNVWSLVSEYFEFKFKFEFSRKFIWDSLVKWTESQRCFILKPNLKFLNKKIKFQELDHMMTELFDCDLR